jgi:hypothetical protein
VVLLEVDALVVRPPDFLEIVCHAGSFHHGWQQAMYRESTVEIPAGGA